MTPEIATILNIIAGILCLAGIITTLFSFPGGWLIFAGYLISGFATDFVNFPIWLVVLVFVVALASTLIDNLAMLIGAKKYGASNWGMAGAIVGLIIGFVVGNVVGMIIGPFIGAIAFEFFFSKKEWKEALKSGFGTFLGFIFSIGIKVGINIALTFLWFYLIF
ncbi:MAG TPA: DUF456 domain-containing protein [Candidatus Dojkabacteria bacterium]|nr:DUF456 domain-containing protein [Candidatus Dojkabacteria bacterium]